ncbi:MAG: phosphatase PAP2 family protein [Gammaproteobacteria bacterium]
MDEIAQHRTITTLIKTTAILAGVLILLTVMVLFESPLHSIDLYIAERIALDIQNGLWFAVLELTELGGSAVIIIVMLVVSLMLIRERSLHLVLPFWLGFLGARFITGSLKYAVGRERMAMDNFVELMAGINSPSYPSGHATSALYVYGFVAYLMMSADLPDNFRRLVVVLLFGLAGMIALSRMLLGVHYLTDVLAGLVCGGMALCLAVAAADYLRKTRLSRQY